MRSLRRALTFVASTIILAGSPCFAAPTITGVVNAASNIYLNSPIAAGAIFVIYGSGLGPGSLSVASSPFQSTNLSGTSVAVTVGSTTVNALMYYTSATQVAALLPSNTPFGSGSFTVTYNGSTSQPTFQGVGPSNFAMFTVDSTGQGAGIVTYPDYSLVSPVKAANCGGPNTTCGAANPGDTLILWGTGLGPVNGSDAAGAGLGQNMPDIPLTVWLGGVQAQVVYQGRSGCCVGEDQVVFTVPNHVPTGCAVPLTVQTYTAASTVSNTTLLAVATGSRNCSPVNPALAASSATAFEQLATSGNPVNVAALDVRKTANAGGAGFVDTAKLQFFKITGFVPGTQPFLLSFLDDQPVGTCLVYSNPNGKNDLPFASGADLNAGSSFTLTGPNGTVTVPPIPMNAGGRTTVSSTGTFLVPGAYTIMGPGGADILPFTSSFSVAGPPTSTGPANNSAVTRASGMTVSWTPAASGNIQVKVVSQVQATSGPTVGQGFTTQCVAPASAGAFTVPAYALLPLLPGNSYYQIISSASFAFTAPGANFALTTVQIEGPALALTLN